MPHPYPKHLFSGGYLLEEARGIISKITDSIARAPHASLSLRQVDDIVQSLYNENQIELPFLKRSEAVLDQFEFYIAPYIHVIKNIDFKKLSDPRHGVIFSLDVPFIGDKKAFPLSAERQRRYCFSDWLHRRR